MKKGGYSRRNSFIFINLRNHIRGNMTWILRKV
jgi:hypothetical protein